MNSDNLRIVKILKGEEWIETTFEKLQEEDIFKLYEPDGKYAGTYKALCNAYLNVDFDIHEIAVEIA